MPTLIRRCAINPQRIEGPLFFNYDVFVKPNSAKELRIIEISKVKAIELNRIWHSRLPSYKTGFCSNATICYGAKFKNIYYAAAIWSNPVARNLPQKEWLELRRLAISPDAPKFTATRMLSKMAKDIRSKFKGIYVLVSYQDINVHSGIIYRAGNWTPDHIHAGGTWNRPNSKNQCGTPRTRPDLNQATGPKQRWIYKLR